MEEYESITDDYFPEDPDLPREIHIAPVDDILDHDASYECICQPYTNEDVRYPDEDIIWIHNSFKENLN